MLVFLVPAYRSAFDLDHALKARRWVVSPNEIELLTFALGG